MLLLPCELLLLLLLQAVPRKREIPAQPGLERKELIFIRDGSEEDTSIRKASSSISGDDENSVESWGDMLPVLQKMST